MAIMLPSSFIPLTRKIVKALDFSIAWLIKSVSISLKGLSSEVSIVFF